MGHCVTLTLICKTTIADSVHKTVNIVRKKCGRGALQTQPSRALGKPLHCELHKQLVTTDNLKKQNISESLTKAGNQRKFHNFGKKKI